VLRDGRTVNLSSTAGRGPSPKMLATIAQVAARYQIPAELTGVMPSANASGAGSLTGARD